jgi:hypothetical protein
VHGRVRDLEIRLAVGLPEHAKERTYTKVGFHTNDVMAGETRSCHSGGETGLCAVSLDVLVERVLLNVDEVVCLDVRSGVHELTRLNTLCATGNGG